MADELTEWRHHFDLAEEELKQQSDMESICRLLQNAGGHFDSNIKDFPEVLQLELL